MAAALRRQDNTSAWLDSPLLPRLLAILRSLPATQTPQAAASLCAATTAALNNIYHGLRYPRNNKDCFLAMLSADDAACQALLHWGLICPEATELLGQERDVAMANDSLLMPFTIPKGNEHLFWSPFTCCLAFMAFVAMDPNDSSEIKQMACFKGAATPYVIERLLRLAAQHPAGVHPPRFLL